MITTKLKIYSCSNNTFVENKQRQYSYAFRKLYKNYDLVKNIEFLQYFKKEFNLSDYEKNCLIIDVKTKINQTQSWKDQTEDKLVDISKQINYLISKASLDKKEKCKLSKLYKKESYFNKSLSKNIVFGKKSLLQKLSFLSNDKTNNSIEIQEVKDEYQQNRLLPINYVGSKNDNNSNRYFNFNFENNKIIYKPNVKTKIEIIYSAKKNYQKKLLQLQKIVNSKLLPITIKLSTEYIYISYDEETLNGFGLDESSRKQEVKNIKEEHIDKDKQQLLVKEVYKKYYDEQKDRQLKNKLPNRYLSIDLNPEYIGCSILDKINENGDFKIVKTFCYDLSLHNQRLKISSTDKKQKYQNNKRKFELYQILKRIFTLTKHYKVSYFVIEDLNFKSLIVNESSKEGNRKTKNLWYRNLIINSISKYCNELGIQLIKINPCYTSFIGNIKYNYFDPINASIEIGRRGIIKYIKNNSFYPKITSKDIDTMSSLLKVRDVQSLTWVGWYNEFKKHRDIKYRWGLSQLGRYHETFSLNNIRSKVNVYSF